MPDMVGVLSLVTRSLFEVPVSLANANAETGALTTVSMTTVCVLTVTLFTSSVTVNVNV